MRHFLAAAALSLGLLVSGAVHAAPSFGLLNGSAEAGLTATPVQYRDGRDDRQRSYRPQPQGRRYQAPRNQFGRGYTPPSRNYGRSYTAPRYGRYTPPQRGYHYGRR
jgi:Ni/Co efflux regulator RcnB